MTTPDTLAAEKARRWACEEHAVLLNIARMRRDGANRVMLDSLEREARRKRGWALLRLRLNLDDRSVPENGTDEEIGAYLGFDVATEGAANV